MTTTPPVGTAGVGTAGGDTVRLAGLRARGRHGCLPAERELGQEFVVDVTLFLDTAPAAAADDLRKTVDYGALAMELARIVEGEPVNLIETLAGRLADACLAHDLVEEAEVSVHKPAAPIPLPFDDVVVTIRRGRP
ncbi:dihydroneopterin aldolase [Microbispora sp. NPDC049125]|uniref:dihydroneopterin aldolase n=1 Tax=Microbispora sp. NPDC049125 TaxID=3154929 RepID=UPI0034667F0B